MLKAVLEYNSGILLVHGEELGLHGLGWCGLSCSGLPSMIPTAATDATQLICSGPKAETRAPISTLQQLLLRLDLCAMGAIWFHTIKEMSHK